MRYRGLCALVINVFTFLVFKYGTRHRTVSKSRVNVTHPWALTRLVLVGKRKLHTNYENGSSESLGI